MTLHYAIGDIHGCDDLLEAIHRQIQADHAEHHGEAPANLIHIGDYIDRGPDSAGAIDRVMRGLPEFTSISLKGNHEQMMLDCLETNDAYVWDDWLYCGGEATLESFGFGVRHGNCNAEALSDAIGPARLEWLRGLKLYHLAEPYLFVHAGIVPGRPLSEQKEKDLIWIRDRFLNSDADHGFIVVHGHTPEYKPELRHNRINVDTGAVYWGTLTAVVLGEETGPRFLSVS